MGSNSLNIFTLCRSVSWVQIDWSPSILSWQIKGLIPFDICWSAPVSSNPFKLFCLYFVKLMDKMYDSCNYCPISLSNIFSRLFEHLMLGKINDLALSVVSQLATLFWIFYDSRFQHLVTYINCTKAFDKISHHGLFPKLIEWSVLNGVYWSNFYSHRDFILMFLSLFIKLTDLSFVFTFVKLYGPQWK